MKKLIVVIISAGIFVSGALASSGTSNYGGIKVGTCKAKTFSFSESTHIDEYELTGFNAVLNSVSGPDTNLSVTVSLCPDSKGKFSDDLLLKNSGNIIDSLHLISNGI